MARRTLSSLDAQFIRPPIHFSNFDELLSVDQRVDAFGAPASATIEAARGLERHNTRSFAGLSEAVSRLQGLGGVVAIAPQQSDAVAEGGSGTIAAATPVPGFTVHITVEDVVCAACEAGDVRSQIATLFLCSVKCALGAALDATQARSMADICAGTATGALCATVAPPHGAESGHDPHVAFRNLQDPDSGLVLERMLHAYTHAPLTAADRHDDTWLAAFGEPKLSRVGYQESIGLAVSATRYDAKCGAVVPARARPVEEARGMLHHWFSGHYYRRQARYGSRRLIVVVYGRAGEIVARRFVESALESGGDCRGIFLLVIPTNEETTHVKPSAAVEAYHRAYGVLGTLIRPATVSSNEATSSTSSTRGCGVNGLSNSSSSGGLGGTARLRQRRLSAMGFSSAASQSALQEAGGNLEAAAVILTESEPERAGRRQQRTLVAMGFHNGAAEDALARTGGDVNLAANLLAVGDEYPSSSPSTSTSPSLSRERGRAGYHRRSSRDGLAEIGLDERIDEESVRGLVRMGFRARAARRALVQCHGNVATAAIALAEQRQHVEQAGLAGGGGILQQTASATASAIAVGGRHIGGSSSGGGGGGSISSGGSAGGARMASHRTPARGQQNAVLSPKFLEWRSQTSVDCADARTTTAIMRNGQSSNSQQPRRSQLQPSSQAHARSHPQTNTTQTPQRRRQVRLGRSGDKKHMDTEDGEDGPQVPPRSGASNKFAPGELWRSLLCCGCGGLSAAPPK